MWPMSLNLRWQDFKLCVDIKKLGINLLAYRILQNLKMDQE